MRWYDGYSKQLVGKHYSYGEGPEYSSELDQLKTENRFFKQQIDVLKKYKELERRHQTRSL